MKKKILISFLVILVAIQLIRPTKNNGNADSYKDITHAVNVPGNMLSILKISCYDCHSNHTQYYWYHEIMPLGWWLNHHVNEGKEELNFSEFASYSPKKADHKLEEMMEEVKEHEMPLKVYTLIHKEASLSEDQIKLVVDWVNSQRSKTDAEK